jgi:uncharacterized membrane protein
MPWSFRREHLLQIFLLLCALALSLEYVLLYEGQPGLCQAESCRVVGRFVRYGEIFFVMLGALFFWLLWLVAFFGTRYNRPFLWNGLLLLLAGGLAFDGAIMGYQIFGLEELCWLCIGVAAGLAAALALTSLARRSLYVLLAGLIVWSAAFAPASVLQYEPRPPKLKETAFLSLPASKGKDTAYYFFFSLDCGHCSEVLLNLALSRPETKGWHMCALNRDREDLSKLAAAMMQAKEPINPFTLVIQAKSGRAGKAKRVPDRLQHSVDRAASFFEARGYSGVPLLIVRESPGKEIALQGVNAIARYLFQEGLVSKWVRPVQQKKEHKATKQ